MKTPVRTLLMLLPLLLATAVAAKDPPPATAAAPAPASTAPPADKAAFDRGAKAFDENCAMCHAKREPKEFDDAQWKVILNAHLARGIDSAVASDITVFVTGSN